jgi:hypothetical protein
MRALAFTAVCLLGTLVGCAAPFPDRNATISSAWLESSTAEAEPARRTIQTVRALTEDEVSRLSALTVSYHRRSLGYVRCNWFIRYETPTGTRRLGLYMSATGVPGGLDFTPPDPSRAYITRPHDILVPTDHEGMATLVESLLGRQSSLR